MFYHFILIFIRFKENFNRISIKEKCVKERKIC